MSTSDPLLQPFELRHLQLANRIMSTSHAPAYVEDAKPGERYQRYHEEKARGGIGLTMFGGSSNVAHDSPSAFGQLHVGDDAIVPYFREFAQRIHAHGTALMCQITHMGHRTRWNTEHWLPTVAPSLEREPAHRSFPKVMEQHDIDRIVEAYAAAARRCRDGGLDGVELLAHGHLLGQFWNPLVNRRDDAYGGGLANRMRFSLEVLEAVRRAVGDDFIVGVRLAGDEMREGGLDADACLEIARTLVETGHVDFLNVNGASIESDEALARHLPGMISPSAPFLHLASAMRRELGVPVLHACRLADVATARFAVSEGHTDLVGMTRAHIADPHIVRKLRAGEEERIRPCVGASYCIDRIYEGGEALCIHNAATGREQTMPHVIPPTHTEKLRVVVVGAGPGGLEAARVCASRGHRVTLLEASGRAGGQIALAARAGWRRDLIGISDWLAAEVGHLGVDVRYDVFAEPDDVLALSPDVVIVATGGTPNTEWLAGHELATTVWDVLSGDATLGETALVFDDNGQHQGPSCAEQLAAAGVAVEIVTPDRAVGMEIGGTNYPVYMKHLYDLGVKMTPDSRLESLDRDGNRIRARLSNVFTGAADERIVDRVIVEHGTVANDELFHALVPGSVNAGELDYDALIAGGPQAVVRNQDGRYRLYRIGDAIASRNIHAAIYDALRLCKTL